MSQLEAGREGLGLPIKNYCSTVLHTGKSDVISQNPQRHRVFLSRVTEKNLGRSPGFDPRGVPHMPDPLSSLACRALWFSHAAPACISLQ